MMPSLPASRRAVLATVLCLVCTSSGFGACLDWSRQLDVVGRVIPYLNGGGDPIGFCASEAIGNHVFLAEIGFGLRVMDVSDPADPVTVAELGTGFWPSGMALDGSTLIQWSQHYQGQIAVIDVSDPEAPSLQSEWTIPGRVPCADLEGERLLVVVKIDWQWVLLSYDLSDETAPVLDGHCPLPAMSSIGDLQVQGGRAYVAGTQSNTLLILDVADPSRMSVLEEVDLGADGELFSLRLEEDVLAVCSREELILCDASASGSVAVTGRLDLYGLPYDVKIHRDRVAVASYYPDYSGEGFIFAGIGASGEVRHLYTVNATTAAGSLAWSDQGWVAAERWDMFHGFGRPAVSVLGPRYADRIFSYWDIDLPGTVIWAGDAILLEREDRLFVISGESGTVSIVDVAAPDEPVLVAEVPLTGVGGFEAAILEADMIWLAADDGSIRVHRADVGFAELALHDLGVDYVSLALDEGRLMCGRWDSRVDVYSVTDPGSLVLEASLSLGSQESRVRAIALDGRFAYVGWLEGRVLDIMDLHDPVVVGAFDGRYSNLLLGDDSLFATGFETRIFKLDGTGGVLEVAALGSADYIERSLAVQGDVLYRSNWYDIEAWNIADPEAPWLLGTVEGDHAGFLVHGDRLYSAGSRLNVLPTHCQGLTPVTQDIMPGPRRLTAHPNPFNPSTLFTVVLAGDGPVSLNVYDAAGRRVRTLVDGPRAAGTLRVRWDGRDDGGRQMSAGVYLARLQTQGRQESRKLLLLK